MLKLLCKLGLHKWGRVKQWIVGGKVIFAARCKRCGALKEDRS